MSLAGKADNVQDGSLDDYCKDGTAITLVAILLFTTQALGIMFTAPDLVAVIFVGLILFKIVQRAYTEVYSPLAVIVAALLAYVLAENLGGSGVLSVTALGLFFGNVYVKEKAALLTIEGVLTKALFIFVFILIGSVIKIQFTQEFFVTSGLLFLAYLVVRFMSVVMVTHSDKYRFKEQMFMTLNVPKGIATAAVVFILAVLKIEGMQTVLVMIQHFLL